MTTKKLTKWAIAAIITGLAVYYGYPEEKLPTDIQVDHIIVYKSARKLEAYSGNRLLKTYTISLGRNPMGHKEFEGDKKTPEGVYRIDDKNPNSGYHKNLGVSYPNDADIAHADSLGKPPGGAIKIHGLRNGCGILGKFHRWADWTMGCIAVTNSEMDELYNAVKIGATIDIRP